MIQVMLKPCSINKAYRGGRRFKTKDYLFFEKEMLARITNCLPKRKGAYEIYLAFHLKNALQCDLSNFVKTTEDIIVKAGLVDDDRFCWRMVVEKFKSETDFLQFDIKGIK